MIDGILAVDKPAGRTSHDVVAAVRRAAGQRQVGHAGTLDPLATGVLLLVLGSATRLSSMLMHSTKIYRAEVVLGTSTITDDAEGPLPHEDEAVRNERIRRVAGLGMTEVETAVQQFVGTLDQVPPAYAAARHQGEKLYVLARKGVEVEPAARSVTIERILVERWNPPRLRLLVICGAGTYIRSLARDLGRALGVGAYLHALRRITSGSFHVSECRTLDRLADRDAVRAAVISPDRAVLSWPALVVSADEAEAIAHGRSIALFSHPIQGNVRLYGSTGQLLALGEVTPMEAGEARAATGQPARTQPAALIKPKRVFAGT